MRIAVIGSGASAFAAVERLLAASGSDLDVTLIAPDDERPAYELRRKDPREWTAREWDQVHKRIREAGGASFPPPRSQFGARLGGVASNTKHTLGATGLFGGLSDFWSTAMFPNRGPDMEAWPLTLEDLDPYYRWIAELVGIAGGQDGLSVFFDDRYVTRPAIRRPALVDRFIETASRADLDDLRVGAGSNRLAVETRPGEERECVYCGGCFYGCHRDALFRPALSVRQRIQAGEIHHWVGRVTHLARTLGGRTEVEVEGSERQGFDRVILCAGALGSTSLLARSLGFRKERIVIHDNEMFNFPIAYHGLLGKPYGDHFSISSGVVGAEPLDRSVGDYAHYLIAPLPALLFSFYIPKRLSQALEWPTRIPKGRFLICQMYTGPDAAIKHELEISDEVVRTHVDEDALRPDTAKRQIGTLRRILRRSPFWLPPFPLTRVSTSYHYAGGFPFGDPHIGLGADCRVWPGLYVADSTSFPASPAQQFTFTIMANAARVADVALASED